MSANFECSLSASSPDAALGLRADRTSPNLIIQRYGRCSGRSYATAGTYREVFVGRALQTPSASNKPTKLSGTAYQLFAIDALLLDPTLKPSVVNPKARNSKPNPKSETLNPKAYARNSKTQHPASKSGVVHPKPSILLANPKSWM